MLKWIGFGARLKADVRKGEELRMLLRFPEGPPDRSYTWGRSGERTTTIVLDILSSDPLRE